MSMTGEGTIPQELLVVNITDNNNPELNGNHVFNIGLTLALVKARKEAMFREGPSDEVLPYRVTELYLGARMKGEEIVMDEKTKADLRKVLAGLLGEEFKYSNINFGFVQGDQPEV